LFPGARIDNYRGGFEPARRVLTTFTEERSDDMSSKTRAPLIIPILIIVIGIGWLLTAKGFAPGINWIWTLALATVGMLTFVLSEGFDKVSVVIGPFFLLASLLSVLRQTNRLNLETEIPVLVISIGVFLLFAYLPIFPPPGWFKALPPPTNTGTPLPKLPPGKTSDQENAS
jgi:hypothetical protein